MKIRLFPNVCDIAQVKELDFQAPDTILQLLCVLAENYGQAMKSILFTVDNKLHPDIIVLLNGRHIEYVKGEKSRLSDSDTVSVFSRIAGG